GRKIDVTLDSQVSVSRIETLGQGHPLGESRKLILGGIHGTAECEIGESDLHGPAAPPYQTVARIDVAVHIAGLMNPMQRLKQPPRDVQHELLAQSLGPEGAGPTDGLPAVLKENVAFAVDLEGLKQLHDIAMPKAS